MLSLKNVRFEILRDPIVRDFSMDLQPGEVKTLFGPSGCGKTTVLRLISGLETPKSGEINNTFRKTGFLFQENRLLENLTAMQNIAIFMDNPNENEIIALAEKIGLSSGDLNKYPTELSGGMAKRVAFLRLLLCLSFLFHKLPHSFLLLLLWFLVFLLILQILLFLLFVIQPPTLHQQKQ